MLGQHCWMFHWPGKIFLAYCNFQTHIYHSTNPILLLLPSNLTMTWSWSQWQGSLGKRKFQIQLSVLLPSLLDGSPYSTEKNSSSVAYFCNFNSLLQNSSSLPKIIKLVNKDKNPLWIYDLFNRLLTDPVTGMHLFQNWYFFGWLQTKIHRYYFNRRPQPIKTK